MQEVLVRGYLYQMIKNNYNIVVAVLISTGLFTFAHGGAFEAGILPVLNVITMSLFVTAVLEYTESLVAPIVIHFLWNGVGAIILGGVSLAEDYPHLFNMVISGNSILSGGSCKIEGSIVVLFMNLILTESSKSPASIAKSNKQWVGTCLYQEECKLLLINCGAVIRCRAT